MANNGIVFISNVAKINMVCQRASKFVQRVLYVKIKGNSDHDSLLPMLSKQIDNFYAKASTHCGNLDVRLMLKYSETLTEINTKYPIDMILYDNDLSKDIDQLKTCVATVKNDYKLLSIDCQETVPETNLDTVKTYENVALGGTFDRLHNGHKILLSQAVLRATKLVTVGVTDVNMIQSKKLWELIEPVEVRMMEVLNFLKDINPDLEYNVFPLRDLYGPTKDDPKYQLIVISEETMKGAIKINEKRVQNGLLPMDVHAICLAEDTHSERAIDEEAKLSSSNQRMRLLGTLLKPPAPNTNIPAWPYIIGLGGGIASGKSSITKYLKSKGAGIVNCDIIAHDLYKPGMPLNETIADTFGRDVITESGEVDRKKLGHIVFSEKAQLEKLNSIIWPAVLEEAQRQFKVYGEKGYRVVVMEAAVLVRAKWYHYCHQLWSVIIPKDEAIKRLQERNNLSEEDARMRVEAQPSNLEQIEHANVVFSPFWSYNYTQSQVDRAWNILQAYLDTRQ